MTKLSVNLNAVAQIRNRRNLPWPSVIEMARLALVSGADGLTVHPRPDERHIKPADVFDLQKLLRDEYPAAEYNIEGFPSPQFLDLVEQAKPEQVTFVPDNPKQLTSDHGWEALKRRDVLDPAMARMWAAGIRIVLFVDAEPAAVSAARAVGAERVELFTGPYGAALETIDAQRELARLVVAAKEAKRVGLEVNAGHDLTAENLPALRRHIPELAEVSIGHSIVADALTVGFARAVRRCKAALGG